MQGMHAFGHAKRRYIYISDIGIRSENDIGCSMPALSSQLASIQAHMLVKVNKVSGTCSCMGLRQRLEVATG